jgi:hypothetical protein
MDALVEKAFGHGARARRSAAPAAAAALRFLCTPERKSELEQALAAEEGAEVLNWKVAREGLVVRQID